ncbi:MAG: hypothetical protein HRT35_38250, partial [Algicola sp.]|nr:hypothetical protein [Algicola sp.]
MPIKNYLSGVFAIMLVCLFAAISPGVFAQQPDLRFEHFDHIPGLANTASQAVLPDKSGY